MPYNFVRYARLISQTENDAPAADHHRGYAVAFDGRPVMDKGRVKLEYFDPRITVAIAFFLGKCPRHDVCMECFMDLSLNMGAP